MKARNKAALWTVYAVISMYSMAYMAQVPLLPYLLQEMGSASSASFGAMQTAFSMAQLLGGLLSGPMLDRFGARSMLLVSLGSAAANYFFTASATSLTVLYISRVCAVMQHALLAARTFIAATAPAESRVRVLSLLSVFNSVGFAAGPALGGALSQFGIRTTAWLATATSLFSVAAVIVMVPGLASARSTPASAPGNIEGPESSAVDQDDEPISKPQETRKQLSWFQSLQVLRYPAVKQLMIVNLAYNVATGLIQCVFALMLRSQYGLSSKANGMVLSYQGALTMVSQALLVEPARRRMGEGGAVWAGCAALAGAYMILAMTSGSVTGLLVALLPSASGAAVLSTVLTAQLTRAAPQQVVGSVLALDMSLFAAVRLVTPAIATSLLDRGGAAALGCAAAGLMVLLLICMQFGWVRSDGGLPPTATKVTPVKARQSPDPTPQSRDDAAGQGSVIVGILPHWVRWASRDVRGMQLPLRARLAP